MKQAKPSLERCLDIFDFFGAEEYEYFTHILYAKSDGTARLLNALPWLQSRAMGLVEKHRGSEDAYPEWLLENEPA